MTFKEFILHTIVNNPSLFLHTLPKNINPTHSEHIQHFFSIFNTVFNNPDLYYMPLSNSGKASYLADGIFYLSPDLINDSIPIQYKFKTPDRFINSTNYIKKTLNLAKPYLDTSSLIQIGVPKSEYITNLHIYHDIYSDKIYFKDYSFLNDEVTTKFKNKTAEMLNKMQKKCVYNDNINNIYYRDYLNIDLNSQLELTKEIKNWKNNF